MVAHSEVILGPDLPAVTWKSANRTSARRGGL
jgi:hypothetical protein